MHDIQYRQALRKITPYKPGKSIAEVEKQIGSAKVIKLASNENPFGPSPKVLEAIRGELAQLNRYPDAQANELKKTIASKIAVNMDQLIITNGADELIKLISETYIESGDEVVVTVPSFIEYEFGTYLMGAKVVPAPLDENFQYSIENILSVVTERTKMIYICSPNNPTGTYMSKAMLEKLLQSLNKEILIVFDGAYSEFATNEDYTNGLEFINKGYAIIVMKTFSKVFGLAGLRIGYGVAPQSIVEQILHVKEPFNVNSIAQVAANVAINDEEHIEKTLQTNIEGRKQLYDVLNSLHLSFIESMSNFVFIHIGKHAGEIYSQLMKRGIITRFGDTWGLPEYLRVSVGTKMENQMFIDNLRDIL